MPPPAALRGSRPRSARLCRCSTEHTLSEPRRRRGLMSKMPRIVAIIAIVGGAIMIVAGGVTYYVVHRELSDQHITVSDDAKNFAGKDVKGPFTAYSQAMAIKKH